MQTITDKLEIERLLTRLTTYIANKLHLSTMAAVGSVCMSKVANFEKKSGKKFCHVKESTYICRRFLRITTMTTIIIKSKKTNVYHSGASGGLVPMQK